MDGDFAPLNKLVLLKEKYPLIKLYVDELILGVYGKAVWVYAVNSIY